MKLCEVESRGEVVNKSKSYLLPLLAEETHLVNVSKILNTFAFIDGIDHRKEQIFGVLYNNATQDEIDEIIGANSNVYDIYIVKDTSYTIVLFEFPERFRYEYFCYINGKYSMFNDIHKVIILNFLRKHYSKSKIVDLIRQILYRDDKLREIMEEDLGVKIPTKSELSSIVDPDMETIKILHEEILENNKS